MRRRFVIWLVVVLMGVGAAAVYTPHYLCQLQFALTWGVTKIDGEYVVLGRLYENDDPKVDVHRTDSLWEASVSSWWSRGPWYGRVEVYDKVEYTLWVSNTDHNTDPRPSRDQYPLIKEAMQRYFDEQGLLSEDGYDTRTSYTYLPNETKVGVARIAVFLLSTVILARVFEWLWHCIRVRVWRQKRGQCVSCGYDCNGLDSEICPECGQNHAVPMSA